LVVKLLSLIVWVAPLDMLVEVGLVLELATALGDRTVFCELRHVVDESIEQAAELLNLDELFFCGHLLFY
jgi:hypothetical protein